MRMRRVLLFALLALIAGCAPVGPNYLRKDPAVPDRFGSIEQGITTGDPVGRDLLGSWWKILQDPILDSLMARALQGNQDLLIAKSRLRQARALSLVAASRRYPDGGFSGSYDRVRRSEQPFFGQTSSGSASRSPNREDDLYLVGFDASWEIDIFGGVRREIEASVADLGAVEESLRDTLVTLQGEVARNYIDYRGFQLRLEIARKAVQIRQESLEITGARVRAGVVSELDLTRARGELSTAEARVPFLEESLLTLLHRIGVLLGMHPMSLADELRGPAGLPRIPENLPAGLPSDLLRRRPDIRKAEREVAAATARIGVSTAELFPRFSLTGSFSYQANQFDRVFRDSSNLWSIGPRFNWAILNFKRILANLELTREVRQEALIRYERSVLTSLEEVENSLIRLSREKDRIAFLTESVASNDLAVELANERYLAGLQSYLAVIDALDARYTAQDELAQSMQNQAVGFVALYKSLGGGWLAFYGEEDWR